MVRAMYVGRLTLAVKVTPSVVLRRSRDRPRPCLSLQLLGKLYAQDTRLLDAYPSRCVRNMVPTTFIGQLGLMLRLLEWYT